MTDEKPIETETYIRHETIEDMLNEFLEEAGLNDAPDQVKELVNVTFKAGWSACMQSTLDPAKSLAMVLLQIMSIQEKVNVDKKENFKVELGGSALESLRDLCNQVVGLPEQWQLDYMVEAVEMEKPPGEQAEKQEEEGA